MTSTERSRRGQGKASGPLLDPYIYHSRNKSVCDHDGRSNDECQTPDAFQQLVIPTFFTGARKTLKQ